jgi:integrase
MRRIRSPCCATRVHHTSRGGVVTAWPLAVQARMKLGAGRLPNDALLFSDLEGNPFSRNVSAAWSDFAASIDLPEVTFHALRHTHASQLIDAGAKPDITLRIYAHLFRKDDGKAAAAINSILGP